MEPKRRLSKIDVSFISLVDKGANQKKIIFKSEDTPDNPSLNKTVPIAKYDEEKGIVYGIVYSPEETDSQGDIASAEEIEKAAYAFMKNGRVQAVDKQHNEQVGEEYVCESWITKEADALFPDDPVGSWAVGIKIEDEVTKQEIRDEKITGLSMAGLAVGENLEKSIFEKFMDEVRSYFEKN